MSYTHIIHVLPHIIHVLPPIYPHIYLIGCCLPFDPYKYAKTTPVKIVFSYLQISDGETRVNTGTKFYFRWKNHK